MESKEKDITIFDLWAGHSIKTIAERISNQDTKVEVIKDLINMMQTSYCLDQPQE
jgi:hypothetical protein